MLLLFVCLAALAAVGFVALAYRRRWHWTGFTARPEGPDGAEPRPAKTLWDWMQLLIIPTGLAVALFALNAAQAGRDNRREERRVQHEQAIAVDRVRADALRAYLQQMSDLMLAHNLRDARRGSDARVLARTLTLTVLPQLDGVRKARVLEFLSTARLITAPNPKVVLEDADMSGINLDLGTAPLAFVSFENAYLRRVNFSGASMGRRSSCRYCYVIQFANTTLTGA